MTNLHTTAVILHRKRGMHLDAPCEFLILKQRNPHPRAGSWHLPGGKVDLDEHHLDAAKREVREETGLKVRALAYAGKVEHTEGNLTVQRHVYVKRVPSGFQPTLSSEHVASAWVTLEELLHDAMRTESHRTYHLVTGAWNAIEAGMPLVK